MSEGPRNDARAGLGQTLLGALITAALVGGGFAGLTALQAWFEQRDAAMLRGIPDVLVSWREGGDAFLPMMLIAIAPLILVPGVFGLSRVAPEVTRRARWSLVGIAAACVAAGVAWGGFAGRQETGVATPFGAAWLYDGKPREHWSWGAATSLGAGCVNQRDEATGKVTPRLNYDVTFPSGRDIDLVRDPGDIRRLVARLTPIDQSLRARGVPRFAISDEGCVKRYAQGLNPAEEAALRTLLSR